MKYTNEIELNLPLNRVIELFDDPENLKHWQPGLQSFEHISGTPGQVGAKSRLKYKMGNREIEMIETILKRDLPHAFDGTYEAKGVYNIVSNKFIPLGPNKTKWVAENEFRFSGFMKLMGWLMPGAFKKQSQKYLEQFKAFAES
ncbi:SRPBCC family protein [Adhaeribacter terreus]|uniref:SRPBCC family protein n=1 Tax=Adhaeribacter terreus TaxID=529703 RepID=A0ABW0EA25_9BACT